MAIDLPRASGPITLDIRSPDGAVIPDGARVSSWQSQLTESGDYRVDVKSPRAADYTLRVSVN